MYVRARVYSVHGSLRLYVSGRMRKRVGGVERGEKAGERWNRGWESRERSSRVKERLVESRPGWAGGGKRAIGWRGGGGNRGESEGDGKLCETRSSAHKPSYITESLTLYPAAPFPPHRRPPSPRDETQLLSATSTHPPRHPSASHSPLPPVSTAPARLHRALPLPPRPSLFAIPYVGE